MGDHYISKSQQQRLATLDPVRIDEATVKTAAEKDAVSKAPTTCGRTPTATQVARWKALQQARLKGAVPAGHRQGTRDRTRHGAQVRLRRATAHQKLSVQERAKLKVLRKSATVVN